MQYIFTTHYLETCGYPNEMFVNEYNRVPYLKGKRPVRHVQQVQQTHTESTARKDHTDRQSQNDRRCFNCNEVGHYSRQCTKPRVPRKNVGFQKSWNNESFRGYQNYGHKSQNHGTSTNLNPNAPAFIKPGNTLN